MIFIDTDILIDILRNYLPARDWLDKQGKDQPVYVPGYAALEVLNGCRNKEESTRALRLLRLFNICWASENASEEALYQYSDQRLKFNIGIIDVLIAATVKTFNGILYTFNQKHYQAVENLQTKQPYSKQN